MMTTFYPICQFDGCVQHRPKSLGDLLGHIYESNMPQDAEHVFYSPKEGSWLFSCNAHKPIGHLILAIRDVQDSPEDYKDAPSGQSQGWPAAWSAMVEPMVMFS